ncbi:unnamed protein product [Spodoptera exigua]|nr:unnamed protein product [Spodoptera exigua]
MAAAVTEYGGGGVRLLSTIALIMRLKLGEWRDVAERQRPGSRLIPQPTSWVNSRRLSSRLVDVNFRDKTITGWLKEEANPIQRRRGAKSN